MKMLLFGDFFLSPRTLIHQTRKEESEVFDLQFFRDKSWRSLHNQRMAIEIEYCGVWNFRPHADRVSAEIKEATGKDAFLIEGGGGIFEIRQDGDLLWKKTQSGVFPADGEAAALFS
jgi:selT/selW/selH-like putative selenoprotein